MNADDVERYITDGCKAVRCCRSDYHNVASAGNDLFPIRDHCRLAREHDTSFGIGMPVQPRAFPGCRIAEKERYARTILLTFEFDCGDGTFPLIATMQDMKHSSLLDAR